MANITLLPRKKEYHSGWQRQPGEEFYQWFRHSLLTAPIVSTAQPQLLSRTWEYAEWEGEGYYYVRIVPTRVFGLMAHTDFLESYEKLGLELAEHGIRLEYYGAAVSHCGGVIHKRNMDIVVYIQEVKLKQLLAAQEWYGQYNQDCGRLAWR